jgi:superfamily II DNA helicase RecQ
MTKNNTKDYNLWLWDSGQMKVMAATTALLQETDRPSVKYVIFTNMPYGEICYHQGRGRGGRAGEFAYVFVIFDGKAHYLRPKMGKSKDI